MTSFKIERPDFPLWASKSVIAEWEEQAEEVAYWQRKFPTLEPDTDEADMLARLLTYEDMKSVWERLPKYKIKPTLFVSMVQCSQSFIDIKPYNLTPKEHAIWLQDVKDTALKLKSLIQFSPYDRILEEKYLKKRQKLVMANIVEHSLQILKPEVNVEEHEKTRPSYESWPDFLPQPLSEVLSELASLESEDEINVVGSKRRKSVRLDKPSHPNAKRSYFIRNLTQELRDFTGQPLRDIVTVTTATVFDTPSLTERQIIRIAP
ncbi:TPA: hypothetical protein NKV27_004545 [Vibrio parahaemolyticus]|nr:hypothetical protein [Vibrio parahaemolyticus]